MIKACNEVRWDTSNTYPSSLNSSGASQQQAATPNNKDRTSPTIIVLDEVLVFGPNYTKEDCILISSHNKTNNSVKKRNANGKGLEEDSLERVRRIVAAPY